MENLDSIREDTLLMWLKRDSRYGGFPFEFSREWISDPEGNDEPVIRLRYDEYMSIDFPYNPEVYLSALKFFNQYWELKRLTQDPGSPVSISER